MAVRLVSRRPFDLCCTSESLSRVPPLFRGHPTRRLHRQQPGSPAAPRPPSAAHAAFPATGWDNGYYVLPHVVRNVEHTAPVSCEEQFGPVVPLIAYDDEQQVLDWANDSDYGLGSSVWTSDPDRGLAFARKVEAGSTFINTIKQSGIGREFGDAGLSEYVEEHSIRRLK
ncbi:aldehyde dehydrogenase family protein [Pseudonocardia sp. NPDC049154]|uniref:aldehyde dehydrogenase family protein n=1 Tax=Pseudonocardia sp. NPDC049154 TaxID=3155501 RepID=UPI0033D5E61C